MKRKASPSPKASAYFSPSESGDSDGSSRSRSTSDDLSPTPGRDRLTKPPRATPDHRRGLRSPNPSPLSPRSRLPPPEDRWDPSDRWEPSGSSPEERYSPRYFSRKNDRTGDRDRDFEDSRNRENRRVTQETRNSDDGRPFEDRRHANGRETDYSRSREVRRKTEPAEAEDRDGKRRKQDEENRDSRRVTQDNRNNTNGRPPFEDRRRANGREAEYRENREVRRKIEPAEAEYRDWKQRKQDEEAGAAPPLAAETVEPAKEEKVERQRPPLPLGRAGGVYVPPFKLAQMMRDVEDKSSKEYQRLTWDALRKSINGLVNKVNGSNLKNILPELFAENLIRGRGLFARSCMKSQMASPTFTHVFAALVAVVNTKFPELGELLLKRIVLQLRRAFKRNDKHVLLAAAKFIAHLVNQQVAHEIVALELLTLLLERPSEDSVEVAVGFVKECGAVLQNLSPQGLNGIFERFRGILHEGVIDKRVQFMIEGVFALRKAKFQGFAAVLPELDLVEEQDQVTHNINLDDELDDEGFLDVFRVDPDFLENEKKYEVIKKEILGDESEDEGVEDSKEDDEEDSDDEEEDEEAMEERLQIQDDTETNLVNLRRTIYLTIMSSVDFEEAGHKLLKIKLEPGQEMELCVMLLECCSQERTYLRYYGLLGQRFCLINRVYQENFDDCFMKQYSMIHRLETNKLRNVAKFFAHLLGTDALPWQALAYIRLTEEHTTSSSRIFIKILFQELSEHLGLRRLNERLSDPVMQEFFDGIFPKDNPKNTRFAINFFTSIGLGGLTDSLREYLKNMPRLIMQQTEIPTAANEQTESSEEESSSGSESSSESETSSTETESESESESEADSRDKKRARRTKNSPEERKRVKVR